MVTYCLILLSQNVSCSCMPNKSPGKTARLCRCIPSGKDADEDVCHHPKNLWHSLPRIQPILWGASAIGHVYVWDDAVQEVLVPRPNGVPIGDRIQGKRMRTLTIYMHTCGRGKNLHAKLHPRYSII
jgi:hypothetical protein